MEIRSCPSYPGFSASACGHVFRDERTTTTITGRSRNWQREELRPFQNQFTRLAGVYVDTLTVVRDAWPDADPELPVGFPPLAWKLQPSVGEGSTTTLRVKDWIRMKRSGEI